MKKSLCLLSCLLVVTLCQAACRNDPGFIDVNNCGLEAVSNSETGELEGGAMYLCGPPILIAVQDTGCCGPGQRQKIESHFYECVPGNGVFECEYKQWWTEPDSSC